MAVHCALGYAKDSELDQKYATTTLLSLYWENGK